MWALGFLAKMRFGGLQPDLITLCALISACVKIQQWELDRGSALAERAGSGSERLGPLAAMRRGGLKPVADLQLVDQRMREELAMAASGCLS